MFRGHVVVVRTVCRVMVIVVMLILVEEKIENLFLIPLSSTRQNSNSAISKTPKSTFSIQHLNFLRPKS